MFPRDTLILIVDDMDSARLLLRSNLEGLGFTNILEAKNGEEALQAFRAMDEIGSPVQLIISDWKMPGLSGLDFLIQVRSHAAAYFVPFLMVTAEGDAPQVVKAIQAGVTDYIVKPFTPELLSKKLSNVWAKVKGRS